MSSVEDIVDVSSEDEQPSISDVITRLNKYMTMEDEDDVIPLQSSKKPVESACGTSTDPQ